MSEDISGCGLARGTEEQNNPPLIKPGGGGDIGNFSSAVSYLFDEWFANLDVECFSLLDVAAPSS